MGRIKGLFRDSENFPITERTNLYSQGRYSTGGEKKNNDSAMQGGEGKQKKSVTSANFVKGLYWDGEGENYLPAWCAEEEG